MQIEGRRPVAEALRAGLPVRKVLVAEGAGAGEVVAAAARRGVPIDRVPRREIDRLARSRSPQGVIALVPSFSFAELEEPFRRASERGEAVLLLALDGVTDPQNVGALARSAEAAGAHGLLLPQRRSAPVTPSVMKAAAGALAWLPVVQVGSLAAEVATLRRRGVWVVTLDADSNRAVWDLDVATEPLCLVVGAEGRGVSRLVKERSDLVVGIPQAGSVGSLNASVAGGVALFEVRRRRLQAQESGQTGSRGGNRGGGRSFRA